MRAGSPLPASCLVLLLAVLGGSASRAQDEGERKAAQAARALGDRIASLISRHYADLEPSDLRVAVRGDRIDAEHGARDFMVHHASKTGRWQDAVKERGPARGGLVLEARVRAGPYIAARAIGSYDVRYYTEHRMVGYDEVRDLHVVLDLRLPPERIGPRRWREFAVPEGLLEAVRAEVARFGES